MLTSVAIRTGRLLLTPVAAADLPFLQAIKADPRVFAIMLGGVRSATSAAQELAADMAFWGAHGYGMFCVQSLATGDRVGLTGLMHRPDGRGIALRFAFWPDAQGKGLAREAASAVLRFAHDRAGLPRVIAVARDSNIASRTLLGGIGMVEAESFLQGGHVMVLYQSVRRAPPQPAP